MLFAEIHTRAGDVFAAELRQTSTLLLAYAASEQITQLLKTEDQVFLGQAFPRAGTLSAPGWANLWDLLPERSPAEGENNDSSTAPVVWQTRVELLLPPAAALTPVSSPLTAAAPPAPTLSRLFLNA